MVPWKLQWCLFPNLCIQFWPTSSLINSPPICWAFSFCTCSYLFVLACTLAAPFLLKRESWKFIKVRKSESQNASTTIGIIIPLLNNNNNKKDYSENDIKQTIMLASGIFFSINLQKKEKKESKRDCQITSLVSPKEFCLFSVWVSINGPRWICDSSVTSSTQPCEKAKNQSYLACYAESFSKARCKTD